MRKPGWVENLKNAHDAETRPPMAWRVTWGHECECREIDLGQFHSGLWFCGASAGDTASDALAREYIGHAKAMLDAADDFVVNGDPHPQGRIAMDAARILDWYIEARRAELNSNP